MLFGVALASVLALGALGLDIGLDMALKVGIACGLLSCGIAAWLRGRSTARLAAPAVLLLSLAAVVLAGPIVGFLLAFGFATGLGSLFAFIGAGGARGYGRRRFERTLPAGPRHGHGPRLCLSGVGHRSGLPGMDALLMTPLDDRLAGTAGQSTGYRRHWFITPSAGLMGSRVALGR